MCGVIFRADNVDREGQKAICGERLLVDTVDHNVIRCINNDSFVLYSVAIMTEVTRVSGVLADLPREDRSLYV